MNELSQGRQNWGLAVSLGVKVIMYELSSSSGADSTTLVADEHLREGASF